MRILRFVASALLFCSLPSGALAEPAPESAEGEDMAALEALLDQPVVTTASRAAERVQTAPSAMFTITAEDIRIRSVVGLSVRASAGVRVFPDAPYLVTGSPDAPELRRQYAHDLPQLHLLLGGSYDF